MTQHVLSLSYGKDSLACLGAIEQLGWPLDRIVHAEVWATDTIPADPPPMMEFKRHADEIILKRYGIQVEHVFATKKDRAGGGWVKDTYERRFYHCLLRGKFAGTFKGFPLTRGSWCKKLKVGNSDDLRKYFLQTSPFETGGSNLRLPDDQRSVVQFASESSAPPITGFSTKWSPYCTGELKKPAVASAVKFSASPASQGAEKNTVVQYLGIASDEPKRLARLDGVTKVSPLAAIGWTEADCKKWCEENDLLSPIYTTATRGGCWFCHNQSVNQLRLLRKTYPDLWALLMKWDLDSPVSFKADGHTVHDFDKRFALEDAGKVPVDRTFRWKMVDQQ